MLLAKKIQNFNRIGIHLLISLYFLLVGSVTIYSQGQEVTYSVENFFINEGLPVIRIYDTAQDQDGQIWLCTETGLFSFNGTEFELKIDFGEINYYPNNILFDNNNNIWLNNYNHSYSTIKEKQLLKFQIYSPELKKIDKQTYLGETVLRAKTVNQNDSGIIYFQDNNGAYEFDTTMVRLPMQKSKDSFLYIDNEFKVERDSVETKILDSKSEKIIYSFKHQSNYYLQRVKDKLLFHHSTGALSIYDSEKGKLKILSSSHKNSTYFKHMVDRNGVIWSISVNSLRKCDLETKVEEILEEGYFKPSSFLTSIFIDREENIWIGSNQGLYKLTFNSNKQFNGSIPLGKSTRAILEITQDELLISTYDGNILYNLKSKKIDTLLDKGTKFTAFSQGSYYYTCTDLNLSKVRTSDHKIILQKTLDKEFKYPDNPPVILNSLKDNLIIKQSQSIRAIDEKLNLKILYRDTTCEFRNLQIIDNEYYLSTTKGLQILNHSFEEVNSYFSDNIIHYVHKDNINDHILWLTTPSFLIKLDTKTKEKKIYDSDAGFINSIFTSIKEDEFGNLWLPSYAGLNKFNKETEEIKIYMVGDGVSNNEFNNYSTSTLSSGEFVFGGISGLTFVNPNLVGEEEISVPEINISECVKINLTNQIDITSKVKNANKITIEEADVLTNIKFSHYSYSELNSKVFRYRILKPSENLTIVPWVNLRSNVLQLGKIPYGIYNLEVQAISRSGDILSEVNQIELEYVTPYMRTNLFKAFAIFFLASFVYFIIHVRSQSLIQQKLALEKEVDIRTIQIQNQKEELEKINNTKDKLFSILAHDLKSPLITLRNISGKINYLIQKKQPDRIIDIGKTIEDKVSNLSVFLDNLLNWSLQQRGHITYNPIDIQLNELTQDILNIYEDQIEEKKLIVANNIPKQALCFADKNSIHAVVRNLISNSIKYSPQGEKITLNFEPGLSYHIYSIHDNGKGIDQKVINSLYNNENIESEKGTKGESGTGLGLLISKELIELNKGHIKFISNSKQGTKVELHLPTKETTLPSL